MHFRLLAGFMVLGLGLSLLAPAQPFGLCARPAVAAQDKKALSFAKDIVPLLQKRCLQCHSGEPMKTKGGLDMSSYEKFMKGGQRGSPVEPGKGAKSIIVKFLDRSEKPYMPPNTEEPATIEEVILVEQWINQGAKK